MLKKSKKKTGKPEIEYFANELAAHAGKIFGKGVERECVEAALKLEGLEKCSVSEAKKIVNAFRNKEVN